MINEPALGLGAMAIPSSPDLDIIFISVGQAARGVTTRAEDVDAAPQLLVAVYEMDTVPAATPVTTPADETVATELLLLLHAPPVTEFAKMEVSVSQMVAAPEIVPASGKGLMVTVYVAYAAPQLLLTV